jgi:Rad3-related DNA helicase
LTDTTGDAAYTVAVRALCEFTAKQGDLDLRFTPSPTAQEGMAGHALVVSRRSADYRREVSLAGEFGPLRVRGRADGYDPGRKQLEEIKTYRGELSAMPDNHRQLHWAQAKIYGHLLCRQLQLTHIRVSLVYFNIVSQKETALHEDMTAAALADFFALHCGRFLAWAEQEIAHRSARDGALTTMAFPHPAFRPGQRQLAEAMYKASSRACALLAQAPTGIGKTVASLFPMLKAGAAQGVDKVFFLAAKTPGRRLALDACAVLRGSGAALPLRVLELSAKTSACEHPDKTCHGESCPLANGFYDRLPAARAAALATAQGGAILDRAALRDVALAHAVCPYYLGTELARWSDVIVGDYNYYFDASAMLYGLTVANDWRVNVLVDEAHNMVSRARAMYSAELDRLALKALRNSAPESLKKPLERLHRSWNRLDRETDEKADDGYRVCSALPDQFMQALQLAGTAIGDYFADHPQLVDADLQRFYFDALQFIRLGESFGDHSLFDISGANATLCIRNIVPAPFLKPRFETSRATALFSATLSPWHYYSDMLGMPDNTAWIDVESPFEAAQLDVKVAADISTRYQHRDRSLAPIAALMARQYAAQPGNYLAFFSSFDYLDKVADLFAARHPEVPLWRQARRMDEEGRAQFLARFTTSSQGIGFAVLGGAFGEGIDLPGARLIGAFVATLGLPQVNPVNEQMRLRMETMFGAGYDYAYLYPGLQKVVQAAGRVIRTQSDRGTVFLIDDRYNRADVRPLLPSWWDVKPARH